eukprot:CAMPEP_0206280170 /NCGR_PEP_ID=MMETSP0047_2-20121206/38422_1 /ASSEMBLY_ACC=CAM_ASM_000192 /TAXON_ID=195065 /ORGANISM="Chroomonas mesostigmatica_cf, Strain CCMP1168" /LENGTH=52 /DNA_ID=CAMNT_0053710187 /DNA_START=15 /DNA_END=170 /DNA_ORIENTATION=+
MTSSFAGAFGPALSVLRAHASRLSLPMHFSALLCANRDTRGTAGMGLALVDG